MDGAILVCHTRKKLGDLVKHESRGWGDDNNALRRIARQFRIPFSYLWRLLYKHDEVKDVRGSVLLKLWIAHEALCERQRKQFRQERAGVEEASGWISRALVSAASALAGEGADEE